MFKATLIRGARQLLTLRGASGPRRGADLRNLGVIQDGAVLIVDGIIHDVGPSRRLENLALARQAHVIDATGRVVMPGFVDTHTHLASGPARIPDYETRNGVRTPTLARTIQELSPRTLQAQALHIAAEAIRHGTTTLETKSGFGLTEANEIKILRVQAALRKQSVPLVSTFLCAQLSPNYPDNPDHYLDWICSHMLPLIHRRKLAEFAEISFQESAFTVEHARRFLLAAREFGFGLKIYTGPQSPPGVIGMAVELGVSCVDHILNATLEDAALLAQSPTIATLLPGPVFYSGTGNYPPARILIDSGAAVALGSHYHPESGPSQNMQMMISLACIHMRMTPAEAVAASTINAAHALRQAAGAGSLEPGKSADLLILGVPDYREIPYHFGVNLVELVMRNGTVLLETSEVKWPNP
ncbi:MAG TPA: amidohydrolase family protein [Bryobacteraceae bacterium]|jgi:imidazolonepropionase|nr:amidohydrolase family protein [Bryobacteraceae bacterium]